MWSFADSGGCYTFPFLFSSLLFPSLSHTDIVQITPLLPGARRSTSTTTVTVWRGRKTRRPCCCGRISQTTTCRARSPRGPAQPPAPVMAVEKLSIQYDKKDRIHFLDISIHKNPGLTLLSQSVNHCYVCCVRHKVMHDEWGLSVLSKDSQDGSLGSLIDETESIFRNREQKYQETIGQIEVDGSVNCFQVKKQNLLRYRNN